jgi:hypothetical protein
MRPWVDRPSAGQSQARMRPRVKRASRVRVVWVDMGCLSEVGGVVGHQLLSGRGWSAVVLFRLCSVRQSDTANDCQRQPTTKGLVTG